MANKQHPMKALVLDNEPGANFSVKVYERDHFALPYHLHHSHELTLILKGTGTWIIGDCISNYSADNLILIGPFLPHVWRSHDPCSSPGVKSITIKFSDQFPIKGFLDLPEMEKIKTLLSHQVPRGIILHGKLREFIKAKILNLVLQPPAIQLLGILDILMSIAESKEFSTIASEGFMINRNMDSGKLSMITSYVFCHLDKPIKLDDLADLVQMHPSAVGRYLKKNTGYSPVDYVNHIRIGYVCRLLSDDNMTISGAGFQAGFNNISHFNRVFKKIKGVTPSEYLNSIKSGHKM